MADVSLRDADRGQLFLVGALALAVLFLSVAVLLNTAIYTENLATRSDGASATDAIGFRGTTEQYAAAYLEYVNHNKNTSYANETTHFERGIRYWSNASARHQAMSGRVTHVKTTGYVRGTRIVQDTRQTFTPAQDTDDYSWAVVNQTRVRNFQLTIKRDQLYLLSDLTNLTRSFHVNITSETGATWSVYVYQPSTTNNVSIKVKNGSRATVGTCTVEDKWATVNFANATFDGQPCEPLRSFENVQPPLNISYHQADRSNGTYTLVIDKVRTDIDNVDHKFYNDDTSDKSPYTTEALYQAKLKLVYRSADTYYRAILRIAPGELHV